MDYTFPTIGMRLRTPLSILLVLITFIADSKAQTANCASNSQAPWNEWIGRVQLNTLDNASEKARSDRYATGYSDWTDKTTTLTRGQNYPLSITPTLSWSGYQTSLFFRVWIDFNGNNIFEDSEKIFEQNNGNQLVTASIAIPTTAVLGSKKMRVSMKKDAYATACETFAAGEVEDYSVNITGGTPPMCGQTTKGSTLNITNNSVTVKWQRVATAINYSYELRNENPAGSGASGLIASGTATDTFINLNGIAGGRYQAFVSVNCNGGGASAWSLPISFTTLEVACNQAALTTLNEQFEGTTQGFLPLCWRNNITRERWDVEANVDVRPTGRGTINNNTRRAIMYRSASTDSVIIMAITPELSNIGAGTHRLRFKAANTWTSFSSGTGRIQIGTSSNAFDPSTFTPFGAPTVIMDNAFREYTVDFANYRGSDRRIAFKYVDSGGDGSFSSIEFDDVIWEQNPVINPCTNDTQAPVFTLIPSDLTINCPNDLPIAAPVRATDNCTANVTVFFNEIRFSAALTTRTWTATDAAGNSESITQRINIATTNDVIPPVLSSCPPNITIQQTGLTTIANWTPPTATDNCSTPSVSSTYNAGSGFPVGTTTVVYTARDGLNNTTTCSFTVTVTPQTGGDVCANPTANIRGGANSITVSGITTSAAVIQIFNSNWSPVDARQVNSSSATIPNLPAGTYNVKVSVLGTGGTWPSVCVAQASVVVTTGTNPCANDVTPPVFTNCPPNISLTTTGTTAVGTWPVVQATDNCTAQPTVSSAFAPGWAFPIGTTNVVYTAKDAANNTVTCIFAVTVTAISNCGQPTKGLATAITDTSVVVKWQRVPSATNYTYELRTNYAPGSGTASLIKSGTTTDTFVRLNYGLTGRYQAFVKANCGAGTSEWSNPISFTTLEVPCNQGALTELNENFENVNGNVGFLPTCWRNNTTRERWDVETNVDVRPLGRGTNNNNTRRAVMYRSTSTDSVIIMAVTPELSNVGTGTHRLRFKAANTWGTPYAGVGKIQIGTSSNAFDPTTFTPFGAPTTILDNTFQEYTVDFANYRGTDRYIAFKYVDGGGDAAFRSLEFDDVIWERKPIVSTTNDIALTISSSSTTYRQWTPITARVSVKNNGTTAMTNVKIELKRPDKTASGGAKVPSVGTFNDYCSGGIECSEWVIPSLAAGATATLDAPFFVLDATLPIVITSKLLASTPTDSDDSNNVTTLSIASQNALIAPNPAQLTYQKPTQLIPIVVQRIAPNPTEGDLIVKLESLDSREVVFNFYDTLGKLVKSETKTVEKGINCVEFSVYELEQGVHFIVPTTTQGHKVPTKFVKM